MSAPPDETAVPEPLQGMGGAPLAGQMPDPFRSATLRQPSTKPLISAAILKAQQEQERHQAELERNLALPEILQGIQRDMEEERAKFDMIYRFADELEKAPPMQSNELRANMGEALAGALGMLGIGGQPQEMAAGLARTIQGRQAIDFQNAMLAHQQRQQGLQARMGVAEKQADRAGARADWGRQALMAGRQLITQMGGQRVDANLAYLQRQLELEEARGFEREQAEGAKEHDKLMQEIKTADAQKLAEKEVELNQRMQVWHERVIGPLEAVNDYRKMLGTAMFQALGSITDPAAVEPMLKSLETMGVQIPAGSVQLFQAAAATNKRNQEIAEAAAAMDASLKGAQIRNINSDTGQTEERIRTERVRRGMIEKYGVDPMSGMAGGPGTLPGVGGGASDLTLSDRMAGLPDNLKEFASVNGVALPDHMAPAVPDKAVGDVQKMIGLANQYWSAREEKRTLKEALDGGIETIDGVERKISPSRRRNLETMMAEADKRMKEAAPALNSLVRSGLSQAGPAYQNWVEEWRAWAKKQLGSPTSMATPAQRARFQERVRMIFSTVTGAGVEP